ncbi:neutral zinc metallopeptidase [Kribbella deserti]|uniref:Neutral zinc metallopeptidase n=1 Tax=Kribbella deserti TaxID=1926257 RepID=A0ABV6QFW6_9ACTN
MSNTYGYGGPQEQPGQRPAVLPPPQAAPWPQQYGAPQGVQQPYGGQPQYPGQQPYVPQQFPGQQYAGQQWPQQYGGHNQFNSFGPPPRKSNGMRLTLIGLAVFLFVGVALAVVVGTALRPSSDDVAGGRPGQIGPSVVPTPKTNAPEGSAEDIMQNSPIFGAGGLGEINCKAEPLGDGSLAAQKRYYEKLFKCLNDGWRPVLSKAGINQPDPGLIVFDKPVVTACGNFKPKSGRVLAFYCYGNNVMYTDVLQMQQAFGPKEDLAFLMVIAHEYGHHIQGVSGLFYARASYLQEHPTEKLDSSRRNELQASCFAGVFSRSIEKSYPLRGRIPEFDFQASNSFGDSPETPQEERTHGQAKSQGFWIMNGFNVGETKACNTFAAPADIVR